ncbi:hypothetical protein BCR44DRAFT_1278227 [Catenaria anguillulae PL171]|uniref:Uncharacterized protein n=1 Tax=Catenaria anguillulae PL171 TaxID=765915 RepID=A0A1Y2HDK1_9FUNG|nr:hypothetical protein BCR44DRAFT_1278227 [Catenaria anguillulae PL171]
MSIVHCQNSILSIILGFSQAGSIPSRLQNANMGAVTKGEGGRVTGVAADLGGPGLHQYVFDAFAVVVTAQVGSLVSSWGWYLLAIVRWQSRGFLERIISVVDFA